MDKNFKNRLQKVTNFFILNFITLCFVYAIVLPRKDWLSFSFIWTICWATGMFLALSVNEYVTSENLMVSNIVRILSLALFLFLVLLASDWKDIFANVYLSFVIPFCMHSNWLIKK